MFIQFFVALKLWKYSFSGPLLPFRVNRNAHQAAPIFNESTNWIINIGCLDTYNMLTRFLSQPLKKYIAKIRVLGV